MTQPKSKAELVSNCCSYAPTGEIVDGLAICGKCGEWASFEECDHEWEAVHDDNGMSEPHLIQWNYMECKKCNEQKDMP